MLTSGVKIFLLHSNVFRPSSRVVCYCRMGTCCEWSYVWSLSLNLLLSDWSGNSLYYQCWISLPSFCLLCKAAIRGLSIISQSSSNGQGGTHEMDAGAGQWDVRFGRAQSLSSSWGWNPCQKESRLWGQCGLWVASANLMVPFPDRRSIWWFVEICNVGKSLLTKHLHPVVEWSTIRMLF